jgi:hypothetical protein
VIHLDPLAMLRLRRGVEHLHRLGPRATAEFLAEIAAQSGGVAPIIELLAAYERRITVDMLRAIGGDRFPPRTPLVAVE